MQLPLARLCEITQDITQLSVPSGGKSRNTVFRGVRLDCSSSAGLRKMKGGGFFFLFSPYGDSVTLLCNMAGRAGKCLLLPHFVGRGFFSP